MLCQNTLTQPPQSQ
uniref:Uncharacterized protein n=1 Tax=Arundo donax TaxID=35708 RepID=A0A0A9GDZ6_ARUDO